MKKVLKIIVGLMIFIVIGFLALTTRKMILLKNMEKEIARYINDNEHYEKITNYSKATTTITEYYCKGDKAVLHLTSTTNGEENARKLLTKYYEGNKENSYFESNGKKVAILNQDQGSPISKIMILGVNFDNNLWSLFHTAVTTSIVDAQWDGKECYLLNGLLFKETYIEKQTGLMLRRLDGTQTDENGETSDIVVEYEYAFGNISESNFEQPDLTGYEIQSD